MAAVTDAVSYYSRVAGEFHASYERDANRLERLAVWRGLFDRFVSVPGFGYDLGCGSGILACELGRRGAEVIGIDGAAGMLAIAERAARESGLDRVRFQRHHLPIVDPTSFRRADFIISSSALEYLESMEAALRSVHGMLKPRGTLIFSVSNLESVSRRMVRALHALTGRPTYVGMVKQFLTPARLRATLHATGFVPVETAYFGKADRVNRKLALILPERFASNMLIAVATRI